MEALRNSTGFQRSSSRPRLSTLSNVFSRGKKKRPVISGPIGPVKNSRGPDFTRTRKATRRISASFSAHGSLASPPTVASSPKPGLTTSSSHQYLSSAAPIKPLPTTSSFQSIYEDLSFESTVQDENSPPSDHKKPALPEHAPQDGSQKNKSHLPNEARRSLVAWQQSYARRLGKPQLLPQGGRMEDKSLMGKLFGTNQNKGGRRILPAMSESRAPIARQAKPVPAVRGRGKRVSIN
ncbi:hypothetical protein FOC1_g10015049 [Fusarium oxysporum f. sp. cubense race 1]|uniref:Uncharacterized protein n=1 Tax=Fusarium oxysporum f. sp. cubense (strain race 1) TaxID=1229664 RepID=N4TWR4_FUSC1|nr:hypothetical protein FOC1_g10015049 [Fusarium oxysporum f. sp. cubense race 1]